MLTRRTLTQRGTLRYIRRMRYGMRYERTGFVHSASQRGSARPPGAFDSLFKNGTAKPFDDQYQ